MKGKDIEKLVRSHLLPHLPEWDVRRSIMFLQPIDICLCAVGFDTSGFDNTLVYADVIVRPLYLQPTQDSFSRVKRLQGPGGLEVSDNPRHMRHVLMAIQEQAIPLIHSLDTPEKIAAGLSCPSPASDPYELEAIAMSFVLLKDQAKARLALESAISGLLEDGRKWCLDMADRLRGLLDQMNADFEAFRSRLPKWREENLSAMGLLEFAAPVQS